MTTATTMTGAAALAVLAERRQDEIVISTMGAGREWCRLSDHALDLCYIPSAMGHASSVGLGFALARPERQVWVLNGDGSLLMNLGTLATITAAEADNLTMVVVENGIYEVTGGQRVAGAGTVDLAAVAQACGFPTVATFDQIDTWREQLPELLASAGPRCFVLRVEPVADDYILYSPAPIIDRLERMCQELGVARPQRSDLG